LRETGAQAQWAGSVCSGGFLTATAGLLDGCEATTYWSLLEVFALFPTLTVAPGYPRWHLDREHRRFSGGGVSSSLDLALELVVTIASRELAERAQLAIQYAPGPPTSAGDPSEAPPALTEEVREKQEPFIEIMRAATLEVIHGR
ncbi:MAG: hypothetical protein MI919_15270, partial [Holophagales bacterium]|nr:hypothetical protein [Holophagales bacterium]